MCVSLWKYLSVQSCSLFREFYVVHMFIHSYHQRPNAATAPQCIQQEETNYSYTFAFSTNSIHAISISPSMSYNVQIYSENYTLVASGFRPSSSFGVCPSKHSGGQAHKIFHWKKKRGQWHYISHFMVFGSCYI